MGRWERGEERLRTRERRDGRAELCSFDVLLLSRGRQQQMVLYPPGTRGIFAFYCLRVDFYWGLGLGLGLLVFPCPRKGKLGFVDWTLFLAFGFFLIFF
jgi:hypothetical protein